MNRFNLPTIQPGQAGSSTFPGISDKRKQLREAIAKDVAEKALAAKKANSFRGIFNQTVESLPTGFSKVNKAIGDKVKEIPKNIKNIPSKISQFGTDYKKNLTLALDKNATPEQRKKAQDYIVAVAGSISEGGLASEGNLAKAGKAIHPELPPQTGKESLPLAPHQIFPENPSLPTDILPPSEKVNPVDKLLQALKEAEPARGKQEKLYTQERAKRIAQVAETQKTTSGESGFYSELGKLKGELPKVNFDSIREKIGQEDIDSLFNQVRDNPRLDLFEKISARNGLAKIFGQAGGTVPTTGEIKLLSNVFPKEVIDELLSKRSLLTRIGEGIVQGLNVPRSLVSSFDLSAPLRQGVFLVGRKEFYPAFGKMFKQFVSEKAYKAAQEEIFQRPTYQLMKQSKLALTDLGSFMSDREERFLSNWAEKIPVIGKGVQASSRAYTGFLNKLRADTFDNILKQAQTSGIEVTSKLTDDLAKFINSATGRGKLGTLERSAPVLNSVLFSPRLMASRFNMLNPVYYANLDSFVRKQALKSLLSFTAIAGTVLTLAKMGGAEVGADARSADFGKIKIGNTRLDILGGFQQYIRLAAQLVSGKSISSTTGKETTLGEGYRPLTRLDIVERFFQGKENPIASFITDWLQGSDLVGNKFNASQEVINRFVPLMAQDIKDSLEEWGAEGLIFNVPALFGVGVQTYKPKTTTKSPTSNPVHSGNRFNH